ncbi:MAG: DUF1501 domain-containing protein [Gemmataceae bacterium]
MRDATAGQHAGGGRRRIRPTPRINQNNNIPGRQHWPHCYSAILAGAGIRGGMVYGESDKIGA